MSMNSDDDQIRFRLLGVFQNIYAVLTSNN